MEGQAPETSVKTRSGTVLLSAETTRTLFDLLDENETPASRRQLDLASAEIPEGERAAVCTRLGRWIEKRPPDEMGSMIVSELRHAALCG